MGEQRRDEAGNTTGRAPPPLTPILGFLLAAAVATAGGLVVAALLANGELDGAAPVTPAPTAEVSPTPIASEEEPELSDPDTGEALAIFTELRRGLERVYRRRDLAALPAIVRPGSPQFRAVRRDLRLLAAKHLLDRTRIRTLGLEVVAIEAGRLVVGERVLIRPRYVDDATYVEVDVDLERSRVTSEWTIEREGGGWRIVGSRTGN